MNTLHNSDSTNKLNTDNISFYFKTEWKVLFIVTISGLIYNIGLVASPWFEGQLAGCLMKILNGEETFNAMLYLATVYILVIIVVQSTRYIKRFYVRRFANNINRTMKTTLYANLISKRKPELDSDGVGDIITKAVLDVDDCAEGMRKFTTEIFDTGVVLVGYIFMLMYYDWRLTLICLIFQPISYFIAEKMKKVVQKTGSAFKLQNSVLNTVTLDRITNAVTYRIYGCETNRNNDYEKVLKDYETSAVKANIWLSAMPPLYNIISMISVLFIIYFGSANILGHGWSAWDIATFTTFIACYTKLSVKSSKAAKLFNSVQKAQVSWKRIKPLLKNASPQDTDKNISLYENRLSTLKDISIKDKDFSFSAKAGEIIGITGPVAGGKSTFGRQFLCEDKAKPYTGSIKYNSYELLNIPDKVRNQLAGYMGHDPELLNDTILNNIALSDKNNQSDISDILKLVCFDKEVSLMENGVNTVIGNGGVRLSGGQAQRVALARTLYHKHPIVILDDPFSALDRPTEETVFHNIKEKYSDCIIFIISHRLYLFPEMDKVIWIENGNKTSSTHEQLMQENIEYNKLYNAQTNGAS